MRGFEKGELVHIVKIWSESQHAWVDCAPKLGIIVTISNEFITVLVNGEKQHLLTDEIKPIQERYE